jgi:hypothetical protein
MSSKRGLGKIRFGFNIFGPSDLRFELRVFGFKHARPRLLQALKVFPSRNLFSRSSFVLILLQILPRFECWKLNIIKHTMSYCTASSAGDKLQLFPKLARCREFNLVLLIPGCAWLRRRSKLDRRIENRS